MDKSQYQPPQTIHSAELYQPVEKEAAPLSPERLRAPFEFIKDIEVLIHSFRDTAEEIEQRNGREVSLRFLPITFVRPPRKSEVIRKGLIDTERTIGGNLFAEKGKYHFWLGDKRHTAYASQGLGDWYIEEISPENPGTGMVTHIETHAGYINKFNHAGQLVPMTLSDLEVFVPAVYYYAHAVMDAYPFEKDRAEVILEGLNVPDDISALLPPAHVAGSQTDSMRAA